MTRRAWIFIWSVLLAGTALVLASLMRWEDPPWAAFLVLTALTTFLQLFKALFKSRQQSEAGTSSYSLTLVTLFAGVLLLPPAFFTLLVIIPHLVEWTRERMTKSTSLNNWYIQPFNIATHIIAGLSATTIYGAFSVMDVYGQQVSPIFAAAAAAVFYVALNHLLVGQALVLARQVSWSETGTFDVENLLSDLIMVCLGYAMAMLWRVDALLILPALAPLVLIYRGLLVPQLKREAQTDPKTGLLNARHFAKLVNTELERSERFTRPMALIVSDLDLLRNINNTYGHLAGDVVLAGIGKIIKETIRDYDIAARFGGEEFALALPEVGAVEAEALAERLRQAVEAAQFDVDTSPTPISATLSLGVAIFPTDGLTLTALTHEADVAVYQAKLQGRNRVVFAADIQHFEKDEASAGDPASTQYAAAFASRLDRAGSGYAGDSGSRDTPVRAAVSSQKPEVAPRVVPTIPAEPTVRAPQTKPVAKGPQLLPASRGKTSWALLAAVLVSEVGLFALGLNLTQTIPWNLLAILAAVAVAVEILQLHLYGDKDVPVSVAGTFAAALFAGFAGVVAFGAAATLTRAVRQKLSPGRTALLLASNLLTGTVVVLVFDAAAAPPRLDNLFALVLPAAIAWLAYFLIDTGLQVLAVRLIIGADPVRTWRQHFGWMGAHYLALCMIGVLVAVAYNAFGVLGALAFSLPPLMIRYAQQQYAEKTSKNMHELELKNAELAATNREIVDASQKVRQFNDELFVTLAGILDARDPYVNGHAAQVAKYATALAEELGFTPDHVAIVRQAAYLHDIGKIALTESVLHKPATLSEPEFDYIKTHVEHGAEILRMSGSLNHLALYVRHHHERWNGSGYPVGLKGEAIPVESRILALCDAAEAMASDRPYHAGMSPEEIVREIELCAGTQFDPRMVEAFVRIIRRDGDKLIINIARPIAVVHLHYEDEPLAIPNWFLSEMQAPAA